MHHNTLRKQHPELFRLWVKHNPKLKYGGDPTPKKGKNYIVAIVNDSFRCFVVIEYNDGWTAQNEDQEDQDLNIPSREVLSFNSNEITENAFISLLMDILRIYSTEENVNQVIACFRTNGPGRIAFDIVRNDILSRIDMENVSLFPIVRRTKYGKEVFGTIGNGWDMNAAMEKLCFDSMRTAQEHGFFTLATDKSKQAFGITSNPEPIDIEPFVYCWLMLSYIRLETMRLFSD
jgi:hypothetical protein